MRNSSPGGILAKSVKKFADDLLILLEPSPTSTASKPLLPDDKQPSTETSEVTFLRTCPMNPTQEELSEGQFYISAIKPLRIVKRGKRKGQMEFLMQFEGFGSHGMEKVFEDEMGEGMQATIQLAKERGLGI